MRLIRAIAATFVLAYSATGLSQDAPAEQAVLRATSCFTDAWNRHDMRAFGLCFAPDADFVNVTAQWWKGRPALEKNHAYLHGTIEASDASGVTVQLRGHGIFSGTSLTFTSTDVRFVRPDLAVVHTTWRMTDDARTPEPRTGVMTLVVLSNASGWQITAVHNTEIARTVR
jgi:ketosteroid isomerase-like protein